MDLGLFGGAGVIGPGHGTYDVNEGAVNGHQVTQLWALGKVAVA